ncbi:cysteine-rich motor neuron 1 protein-like, partial [Pogonomyrmex barbatus]|uniref:Cysteine-rich motor neuron 1 protein-like n=1 Tax=Pogonomyrmex barbatus TaxID=144034 RepID=A0A8N1SAJ1_9HYME
TSLGESAAQGDREQVGEGKESRRNGGGGGNGGWQDDERATRSTRIAWTGAAHDGVVDGCPQDSVPNENGVGCKCADCPPHKCRPDQQAVLVRGSFSGTPGNCCPRYNCIPSDHHHRTESFCPEDSVLTDDGICKCVPTCPPPKCRSGQRPVEVRAAKPETPGSCCPLHDCRPSEKFRRFPLGNAFPVSISRTDDSRLLQEVDLVPDVLPEDYKVCPELPHCGLNCNRVKDEDGCPVCACQTSPHYPLPNVTALDTNDKKVCPEVNCDLHCELVMDENDCTFCECKPDCPPLLGCRKKCSFGYKTNKHGCPICRCRATCKDHLNKTHPEGSTWHPNSCSTCTCESGGQRSCTKTMCLVACNNPSPPKPGTCCPVCPITTKENDMINQITSRGWGTVPITLIVVLALLCLLLIIHIVRNRFRGRLSPSEASYASYPPQYYKCVPVYDTPVHRNEKIVPL